MNRREETLGFVLAAVLVAALWTYPNLFAVSLAWSIIWPCECLARASEEDPCTH